MKYAYYFLYSPKYFRSICSLDYNITIGVDLVKPVLVHIIGVYVFLVSFYVCFTSKRKMFIRSQKQKVLLLTHFKVKLKSFQKTLMLIYFNLMILYCKVSISNKNICLISTRLTLILNLFYA